MTGEKIDIGGVRFTDGPAAGVCLQLRRAPVMLRMVRDRAGKWDALNELDDEVRAGEEVFLYIVESVSSYHLKSSMRGASGWWYSGSYRQFPEQVDREIRRNNRRWRDWCDENQGRITEQYRRCGRHGS